MNLKLVRTEPPPQTHEQIFVEKFPKICQWAMQLAEREQDVADDLVQDAYVQFTLSAPDLREISNLDGYIYGVLRNLRLSQIRREARQRLTQISVIEYDSASDGLQTIDWRDQFLAQDELRRVCRFLGVRKDTARQSSILILRFFHAYFPSEIMQILRVSRSAVDVRLLAARKEVKAFLDDPTSAAFANLKIEPESFQTKTAATSEEFMNELRQTIFKTRRGNCLTEDFLKSFYQTEQNETLEIGLLAHLVSCAECLEKVNLMLNLPKLRDRYPDDTFGREKKKSDHSDNDGGSGGSSSEGEFLTHLQRRARRVFEHRPSELRVVVNGIEQGSMRVGSEKNELNLNVNLTETHNFIEIFSEQNLRLLMLSVEDLPPAGKTEILGETLFSDQRNLATELRFNAQGAILQVIYADPTFRKITELLESPTLLDDFERSSRLPKINVAAPTNRENRPQTVRQNLSGNSFKQRAADFFGSYFRFSNRGLAFASILALLVTGFALSEFMSFRTASAAERILQASEAASRQFDGVIYRRIRRTLIAPDFTREFELEKWRDAQKDVLITRSYTPGGDVLAETHFSASGKKIFVTPTAKLSKTTGENIIPAEVIKTVGKFWDRDLEAKTFREFVGDVENMRVEETPDLFVINYDKPTERLINASITIRKSDLRPIKQTYVLAVDGKNYSMAITELKLERFDRDSLNLENFPPAPGLIEKK